VQACRLLDNRNALLGKSGNNSDRWQCDLGNWLFWRFSTTETESTIHFLSNMAQQYFKLLVCHVLFRIQYISIFRWWNNNWSHKRIILSLPPEFFFWHYWDGWSLEQSYGAMKLFFWFLPGSFLFWICVNIMIALNLHSYQRRSVARWLLLS